MNSIILIGYSGHSYVVEDIFASSQKKVFAYCDNEEKIKNPLNLKYLGSEKDALKDLVANNFFIAIGENTIRKKLYKYLSENSLFPTNAIHAKSIISSNAILHNHGIMVGAGSIINPFAQIAEGVICNTNCIIEHECIIKPFAHIGPGAILCGNVQIGENTFIGAGAIVKQGIKIGNNVVVGAGAVVVTNIVDNVVVKGCPAQ
jgi:sugar O-acyltransferase (sialic acid O-acetyltransferase NeuD family)